MEAACEAGLVTDVESLRSFLYGRLWTVGTTGAAAAAAICARAGRAASPTAMFRSAEAELDARISSPATRDSSRAQGGHLLRLAFTITSDELLDALSRATLVNRQRPHFPTAVGAVASMAGCTPFDAAEAAAYATVAGPAFAAQTLLGLRPEIVNELGVEMAPEVARLAHLAAGQCDRPLADLPAAGAPALAYLAEEPQARAGAFVS
jgi:urease accessory protein